MNHIVLCGICDRKLLTKEEQYISLLEEKKDPMGLGGATTVCRKHVNTHGVESPSTARILGKNCTT